MRFLKDIAELKEIIGVLQQEVRLLSERMDSQAKITQSIAEQDQSDAVAIKERFSNCQDEIADKYLTLQERMNSIEARLEMPELTTRISFLVDTIERLKTDMSTIQLSNSTMYDELKKADSAISKQISTIDVYVQAGDESNGKAISELSKNVLDILGELEAHKEYVKEKVGDLYTSLKALDEQVDRGTEEDRKYYLTQYIASTERLFNVIKTISLITTFTPKDMAGLKRDLQPVLNQDYVKDVERINTKLSKGDILLAKKKQLEDRRLQLDREEKPTDFIDGQIRVLQEIIDAK